METEGSLNASTSAAPATPEKGPEPAAPSQPAPEAVAASPIHQVKLSPELAAAAATSAEQQAASVHPDSRVEDSGDSGPDFANRMEALAQFETTQGRGPDGILKAIAEGRIDTPQVSPQQTMIEAKQAQEAQSHAEIADQTEIPVQTTKPTEEQAQGAPDPAESTQPEQKQEAQDPNAQTDSAEQPAAQPNSPEPQDDKDRQRRQQELAAISARAEQFRREINKGGEVQRSQVPERSIAQTLLAAQKMTAELAQGKNGENLTPEQHTAVQEVGYAAADSMRALILLWVRELRHRAREEFRTEVMQQNEQAKEGDKVGPDANAEAWASRLGATVEQKVTKMKRNSKASGWDMVGAINQLSARIGEVDAKMLEGMQLPKVAEYLRRQSMTNRKKAQEAKYFADVTRRGGIPVTIHWNDNPVNGDKANTSEPGELRERAA